MKGAMGGGGGYFKHLPQLHSVYDLLRIFEENINKKEINGLQCWYAFYMVQSTHVNRQHVHKLKE
jgi:hypothetical protein